MTETLKIRPADYDACKRSGPFKPSIPSSAEQRGARIEGCGKRGESSQTRTLRYGLHFIPAYSGCLMVTS
jgi:hypothetical protein